MRGGGQLVAHRKLRRQTATSDHAGAARSGSRLTVQGQARQAACGKAHVGGDHADRGEAKHRGAAIKQLDPAGGIKGNLAMVAHHLAQRNDGGDLVHQLLALIHQRRGVATGTVVGKDRCVEIGNPCQGIIDLPDLDRDPVVGRLAGRLDIARYRPDLRDHRLGRPQHICEARLGFRAAACLDQGHIETCNARAKRGCAVRCAQGRLESGKERRPRIAITNRCVCQPAIR